MTVDSSVHDQDVSPPSTIRPSTASLPFTACRFLIDSSAGISFDDECLLVAAIEELGGSVVDDNVVDDNVVDDNVVDDNVVDVADVVDADHQDDVDNDKSALITHCVRLPLKDAHMPSCITQKIPTTVLHVLPHYIEDCFTLRLRLPVDSYLLPDPPLLSLDPTRRLAIDRQLTSTPRHHPLKLPVLPKSLESTLASTSASATSDNFLHGHTFHIQPDYPIDPTRLQTFHQHLLAHGATIAATYEPSHATLSHYHVLVQHESSALCKQARRDGVATVATMYWLMEVLWRKSVEEVPAREHLLYRPCMAHHGVEKFQKLKISCSAYGGVAREIIKTMIVHMGATYTATLTPDVNVLICSVPDGDKYHAARRWNINIVNHLWIEHIWKHGVVPAFTEPRFLVLRPGLSALVGRCSEDENPWEMDENEEAIANVHVPPDTVKPVANTGVPSAKRQTISIEVPGKDYRDQADNHRPRKSSKLSRKDVHGRSM